jgi:hypothetical protein
MPLNRWRISIYVLVGQLVLENIQQVAFFIGFTRAFASIRRKMMLNILMQVCASQCSNVSTRAVTVAQDMGFFEERDSANLIGRLTNQVLMLPLVLPPAMLILVVPD